jgi:hypothetical protein
VQTLEKGSPNGSRPGTKTRNHASGPRPPKILNSLARCISRISGAGH